jgi:hypothetical protein
MNLKLTCLTLGAFLVLGAGTLDAQETSRWSVSAALGLGTDSLNTITNAGTTWTEFGAYNFDVGYRGMIAGSGVPFRAAIGLNYCPAGKSGAPAHTITPATMTQRSLMGYYLAGDMYINSRINDNLFIIVGMSINKWELTENIYDDEVSRYLKEKRDFDGPKFGGRFGLEYKISEKLSFNAIMQYIEFGHDWSAIPILDNDDKPTGYTYADGTKPWNPSWLQFGFKYTF